MKLFRTLGGAWIAALLVACGGGSADQPQEASADQPVAATSADAGSDLIRGQAKGVSSPLYGVPAQGVDTTAMKQRLATRFNGRLAQEPEKLMGQRERYAGTRSVGPQPKAYGGAPTSVHRFLNVRNGSHFYTMSEAEKVTIERTLPHYQYEGQGFFALTSEDAPLSPVFRFYSIYTGTHFYTIDPEERDFVRQYYWQYFNYEGVSWYATVFEGPGWVPMHRFFNNAAGTHFYTTSEEERLSVIATAPHMEYEGIGYYVRADGLPLMRSPVSGAFQNHFDTSQLCLQPSNPDTPSVCGDSGSLPLPMQVEGRREYLGPTNERYVVVPGQPISDCVIDRFTGLTWEKKTNGGARDEARRFTHLDRIDRPQVVVKAAGGVGGAVIDVPRSPTQAELDAATNSLSYVNYVNSVALCGFTDWRIPSSTELLNAMRLLWGGLGPLDTPGRFISSDGATWTRDQTLSGGEVVRSSVDGLITLGHDDFNPYAGPRPAAYDYRAVEVGGQLNTAAMYRLMLVRGATLPGTSRFRSISVAYGLDAAGNVVHDTWSGLQWRRCVEGQRWTGASCIGSPAQMSLAGALGWAAGRPGWRLAGAKELDTLRNHQSDLTAVQTYTDHFPMSGMNPFDLPFWSMSMFLETEYREDPIGSGQWGFVDWVEAFQPNFRATAAGSIPATFLPRRLPSSLGYVRLVRVHP